MTMRRLTVAASCILLTGCTHSVQDRTFHHPVQPPAVARKYAVTETLHRQVRNAVDAGDGDAQIRALRQRLATHPDDLEARTEIARRYAEAGFPEVALEHYRLAAMRFPDSEAVAVQLARTLSAMSLPLESIAALQSFLASHADAGWRARSWLGIFQDEVREYAAAEANHREALRLRPTSDALHNNLGYNLLLQGKNVEAAAEFRRALEIAPGSALARSNLAIALAAEPGRAVEQFQSLTDPATAHSNLAAVLIERGEYKAARHELELALGYRKDHPAALSNLALVSALDGGEAGFAGGVLRPSWQRFLRTLGVVLFGEPERPAKPASAPEAKDKEVARAAGVQ